MDQEHVTVDDDLDVTMELPTRDMVGGAFDTGGAVQRVIADVSKEDLWAEVSRLSQAAKDTILRTMNLRRGAKLSRSFAGQILDVIRRGGSRSDRIVDAMTIHGYPITVMSREATLALLAARPDCDLDIPNEDWELASALVGYDSTNFKHRLGLVRAARVASPSGALLAIALLAEDDPHALAAYRRVASGRRGLPSEPTTLSAIRRACARRDATEDGAVDTADVEATASAGRRATLAVVDDEIVLETLDGLIADAPEVAASLAMLAESVAGSTVAPEMTNAVARAAAWITDALSILPSGGSVADTATSLRQRVEARRHDAARRQTELAELQELYEVVRSFEEGGKSHLAAGLLRGSGFDRIEDLVERVAAARGVAPMPADFVIDGSDDPPASSTSDDELSTTPLVEEPEPVARAASMRPAPPDPEPEVELRPDLVDGRSVHEVQPEPVEDAPPLEVQPEPADDVSSAQPGTEHRESNLAAAGQETATQVVGPMAPADDDTPQWPSPWDDGTVASLMAQERDALAALVAEAAGVGTAREAALRLFTGAFQCSEAVLLDGDLARLDLSANDRDMLDADGARVVLAAATRVAMTFGFSPFGQLDDLVSRAHLSDHPAESVMVEAAMLSKTDYRHQQLSDDAYATPEDWAALAGRAEELRDQLGSPNIVNYQRAARILRHLVQDGNPLGRGLSAVARGARAASGGTTLRAQDWAEIRSLRDDLRDHSRSQKIVTDADRTVHTPQQYREPIKHGAERRLRDLFDTVADTFDEALRLAARTSIPPHGGGRASATRLMAAMHAYSPTADGSVGDVALDRVIRWLAEPSISAGQDSPVHLLVESELDPLFEIPRDSDGHPAHGPTREDLNTLIAGRNAVDVVIGYLAQGNEAAAEAYRRRTGVVLDNLAEESVVRARAALQGRRRKAIDDADRTIGRLRSLNDDDRARQLHARLGQFRGLPENGRSDLAIRGVAVIAAEAEARLADIRRDLRTRLGAIADGEVRSRIEALLESGNESLALEFITRYETHRPLPDAPPLGGDDFVEFYPRVVQLAADASAPGTDTVRVVRRALGVPGEPATPVLERGLRAWEALGAQKRGRGSSATDEYLTQVLRMIGLVPRPHTRPRDITKRKNAGVATWDVAATPIDRSYVPEFGTQTNGRFYVTVVWDAPSAKRVLESLDSAWSTRANIVLYFGTLPLEQRRLLRRACASQRLSPIVIDDAVVAWLTTRPEQGWRITQRVTLPFTAINPFTPFARGEVPDEMFVGREHEQADIIDPTGPMFVYGGRQLGKSALLRKVERRWRAERARQGDDGVDSAPLAIYLDLNAEGVAGVPENLWPVLGRRLLGDGVATAATKWTVDTTLRAISTWLGGDSGRQLLLLLDEADAFLTADSLSSQGTGEPFPSLQRLKGLMQESGNRFKTVFAGLHQVQRFYHLRNHPTGHGGREILVGPLQPADAADLLRNPLHALGYEFESDETMWRLLLVTNYQASLIQIMGDALIRHMLEKYRQPEGGVRVVVTDRDVDDVFAKRDVRTSIEERFRWTIRLDNRYLVIALVIALRTLDGVPGEGFSPEQVREDCEVYWPAGFDRGVLSTMEYRRYLSEMVGLGVLYESGSGVRAEYGLSNQAILGLLGSRDDLEADLADCETLEVDVEANQTMNRRVLARTVDGHDLRAPLSDGELAALVSPAPGALGRHVVIGTQALGIRRVAQAVSRAAEDVGVSVVHVRSVAELVREVEKRAVRHLVFDLTRESADAAEVRSAIAATPLRAGMQVTVILDAKHFGAVAPDLTDWTEVVLRRWSESALKCWEDTPLVGPVDRRDLRSATSGWAELVESTVARVNEGQQKTAALDEVRAWIADPANAARFLASVGIDLDVATRWAGLGMPGPWGLTEIGEILEVSDPASVVEDLVRIDVVDESIEGWSLDPLVIEAVLASAPK